MKTWVELERTGQRFVIRSPYSQKFVEALKVAVPYEKREWDGVQKVWAVDRKMWPQVRALLVEHYEEEPGYGPAMQAALVENLIDEVADTSMTDYAILGLRTDAPLVVIHAAWVALVREFQGVPQFVPQHGDMSEGLPDPQAARAAYRRICMQRGVVPVEVRDPPKLIFDDSLPCDSPKGLP